MSISGWYPDPAGTQGRYRYWNGNSWSHQTTSDPSDPAPDPEPAAGRGGDSRSRLLLVALAAVLAIVLVGWLILVRPNQGGGPGGSVPEDTNSSTPTISGWDESSRPTPPPSQASMIACPFTKVTRNTNQPKDGRLHGGGISIPKIDGWIDQGMHLDWASDVHTQIDTVRPGWISNIGVAQLNAADGFNNIQVGARQSMECFSTSGYYQHFTGRVDLKSEQVEIDGHPAWWIRSEVRIDSAKAKMPEIPGDTVDVIVIDLGVPDHMGMFFSSVTIGDESRQRKVDAVIDGIQVG